MRAIAEQGEIGVVLEPFDERVFAIRAVTKHFGPDHPLVRARHHNPPNQPSLLFSLADIGQETLEVFCDENKQAILEALGAIMIRSHDQADRKMAQLMLDSEELSRTEADHIVRLSELPSEAELHPVYDEFAAFDALCV